MAVPLWARDYPMFYRHIQLYLGEVEEIDEYGVTFYRNVDVVTIKRDHPLFRQDSILRAGLHGVPEVISEFDREAVAAKGAADDGGGDRLVTLPKLSYRAGRLAAETISASSLDAGTVVAL